MLWVLLIVLIAGLLSGVHFVVYLAAGLIILMFIGKFRN